MAAAVSVPFTTVTPGVPLPAAPFLLSRPLLWHSESWTIFTALPGTTESDAWVSMTNVRTGEAGSLSMDAGGLDPFAFPAIVGDSFVITVRSIVTGDIQSYGAVVPATSTPQVVKSTPAAGQQDVWLGSSVEVEFSEPIAGTHSRRSDVRRAAEEKWPGCGGRVAAPDKRELVRLVPRDLRAVDRAHLSGGLRTGPDSGYSGRAGGDPSPARFAFHSPPKPSRQDLRRRC